MGRPGYCTREAVKTALDSKATAYDDDQVDRAVMAAPESIDALLKVTNCDPRTETRSFDWPNDQRARSWRLWLEADYLVSLTSATAGGEALTGLIPQPRNSGPPYTWVEADLAGSSSFRSGSSHQGSLGLLGVWGVGNDQVPAGALAGAVGDTTGTSVTVSDGSKVGVWSLLRVDSESLIVTARGWADSGENLGANLDDLSSDQLVNLTDGTAFHVGESILIDAEEMLLVGITGNNGIVARAWNGSTLAAHTSGADIYASRALTVERAASGSAAATHSDAAAVTRWQPPRLIESLAVAEAQVQVEQEQSGWARTVGEGEAQREAAGRALGKLREQVKAAFGRMRTG